MTGRLMSVVCTLTGLGMALSLAGCAADRATARIGSSSSVPSTSAEPAYTCPREHPFDAEMGLVPPKGSRTATEREFRRADLTGLMICGWTGAPGPHVTASSDPLAVHEMKTQTVDELEQSREERASRFHQVQRDAVHWSFVRAFFASDGATYIVGASSYFSSGYKIDVIYALG